MLSRLVMAFALMLMLEGILPLVAPLRWKELFRHILTFTDGQVRFFGLTSFVIGVILLLMTGLF